MSRLSKVESADRDLGPSQHCWYAHQWLTVSSTTERSAAELVKLDLTHRRRDIPYVTFAIRNSALVPLFRAPELVKLPAIFHRYGEFLL